MSNSFEDSVLLQENEKLKERLYKAEKVALRPCELVRQYRKDNDLERSEILKNMKLLIERLRVIE